MSQILDQGNEMQNFSHTSTHLFPSVKMQWLWLYTNHLKIKKKKSQLSLVFKIACRSICLAKGIS
mgnify:CR=1 FL=1